MYPRIEPKSLFYIKLSKLTWEARLLLIRPRENL